MGGLEVECEGGFGLERRLDEDCGAVERDGALEFEEVSEPRRVGEGCCEGDAFVGKGLIGR